MGTPMTKDASVDKPAKALAPAADANSNSNANANANANANPETETKHAQVTDVDATTTPNGDANDTGEASVAEETAETKGSGASKDERKKQDERKQDERKPEPLAVSTPSAKRETKPNPRKKSKKKTKPKIEPTPIADDPNIGHDDSESVTEKVTATSAAAAAAAAKASASASSPASASASASAPASVSVAASVKPSVSEQLVEIKVAGASKAGSAPEQKRKETKAKAKPHDDSTTAAKTKTKTKAKAKANQLEQIPPIADDPNKKLDDSESKPSTPAPARASAATRGTSGVKAGSGVKVEPITTNDEAADKKSTPTSKSASTSTSTSTPAPTLKSEPPTSRWSRSKTKAAAATDSAKKSKQPEPENQKHKHKHKHKHNPPDPKSPGPGTNNNSITTEGDDASAVTPAPAPEIGEGWTKLTNYYGPRSERRGRPYYQYLSPKHKHRFQSMVGAQKFQAKIVSIGRGDEEKAWKSGYHTGTKEKQPKAPAKAAAKAAGKTTIVSTRSKKPQTAAAAVAAAVATTSNSKRTPKKPAATTTSARSKPPPASAGVKSERNESDKDRNRNPNGNNDNGNSYSYSYSSNKNSSININIINNDDDDDDDPLPKRPPTTYLMYTSKLRPKIAAENPDRGSIEISKILGEIWKKVPGKTKDQLKDDYEKDMEVYREKMREWELRNPGRSKHKKKKKRKSSLAGGRGGGDAAATANATTTPSKTKKKPRVDKTKSSNDNDNSDVQWWAVEGFRDRRIHPSTGKEEYLIKWKGCPESSNTWEPSENLNVQDDAKAWWEHEQERRNAMIQRQKRIDESMKRLGLLEDNTNTTDNNSTNRLLSSSEDENDESDSGGKATLTAQAGTSRSRRTPSRDYTKSQTEQAAAEHGSESAAAFATANANTVCRRDQAPADGATSVRHTVLVEDDTWNWDDASQIRERSIQRISVHDPNAKDLVTEARIQGTPVVLTGHVGWANFARRWLRRRRSGEKAAAAAAAFSGGGQTSTNRRTSSGYNGGQAAVKTDNALVEVASRNSSNATTGESNQAQTVQKSGPSTTGHAVVDVANDSNATKRESNQTESSKESSPSTNADVARKVSKEESKADGESNPPRKGDHNANGANGAQSKKDGKGDLNGGRTTMEKGDVKDGMNLDGANGKTSQRQGNSPIEESDKLLDLSDPSWHLDTEAMSKDIGDEEVPVVKKNYNESKPISGNILASKFLEVGWNIKKESSPRKNQKSLLYLHQWQFPLSVEACKKLCHQSNPLPNNILGEDLLKYWLDMVKLDSPLQYLFMGKADTMSRIHRDNGGLAISIAPITGEKECVLVHRDDGHACLYHNQAGLDSGDIDLNAYPLLPHARIWKTTIKPGEILLMPHGTYHQCRNITPCLSYSRFHLDGVNLRAFLHSMMDGDAPELHQDEVIWNATRELIDVVDISTDEKRKVDSKLYKAVDALRALRNIAKEVTRKLQIRETVKGALPSIPVVSSTVKIDGDAEIWQSLVDDVDVCLHEFRYRFNKNIPCFKRRRSIGKKILALPAMPFRGKAKPSKEELYQGRNEPVVAFESPSDRSFLSLPKVTEDFTPDERKALDESIASIAVGDQIDVLIEGRKCPARVTEVYANARAACMSFEDLPSLYNDFVLLDHLRISSVTGSCLMEPQPEDFKPGKLLVCHMGKDEYRGVVQFLKTGSMFKTKLDFGNGHTIDKLVDAESVLSVTHRPKRPIEYKPGSNSGSRRKIRKVEDRTAKEVTELQSTSQSEGGQKCKEKDHIAQGGDVWEKDKKEASASQITEGREGLQILKHAVS